MFYTKRKLRVVDLVPISCSQVTRLRIVHYAKSGSASRSKGTPPYQNFPSKTQRSMSRIFSSPDFSTSVENPADTIPPYGIFVWSWLRGVHVVM